MIYFTYPGSSVYLKTENEHGENKWSITFKIISYKNFSLKKYEMLII